MKLSLLTIGRLKKGPEQDLFARYWDRVGKLGRSQGLTSAHVTELPESRNQRAEDRKRDEADRLLSKITPDDYVLVLDERGRTMNSLDFKDLVGKQRDQGRHQFVIVIGGADGLHTTITDRADHLLSFGKMTWPHQLVRVLAAEQVYRACSLMAGHPYHKV